MKQPTRNTVRTSFGTVLGEVNPTNGKFKVNEDVSVLIDTPLQDIKGTKKTFLKDSVVEGTLWVEADRRHGKHRKVVMVQDEKGRYLIPKKILTPITQAEIDAQSEIERLGGKVEELLSDAKKEAKSLASESSDFLEKKYAGFTGKQILVGAVGVIVLVKLFK
jgi:hypothetical protein